MLLNKVPDHAKLDRIVAEAHRNTAEREQTYRERALKYILGYAAAVHENLRTAICNN